MKNKKRKTKYLPGEYCWITSTDLINYPEMELGRVLDVEDNRLYVWCQGRVMITSPEAVMPFR